MPELTAYLAEQLLLALGLSPPDIIYLSAYTAKERKVQLFRTLYG